MRATISLYSADGRLYDVVSERVLARLEASGLIARVIWHRKGHVNRAMLFVRPGEAPMPRTVHMGTRYSFKDHLEHGVCWDLKRLGGARLRIPAATLSAPRAEPAAGWRERAVHQRTLHSRRRASSPDVPLRLRTGFSSSAIPINSRRSKRRQTLQPLTPAVVLANAGHPFAAPKQHLRFHRFQRRERSTYNGTPGRNRPPAPQYRSARERNRLALRLPRQTPNEGRLVFSI